jgi:hypothetical protein
LLAGDSAKRSSRAALFFALKPDYASVARKELGKLWDPELVEHLINGLRKAGLKIVSEQSSASAKPPVGTES